MSDIKKPVPPARRPGSQVAPGQKPFHRPGAHTASTHSRVPLHQATAGKLYRVRDRADADGNAAVWGDLLSHADALKLKETVCGTRQSKTARVEEMTPVEITAARTRDSDVIETDLVDTEGMEGVVDAIPEPVAASGKVPIGIQTNAGGEDFTWVVGLVDRCGVENGKWADELVRLSTERGIRLSKLDETFIHVFFQQMKLVAADKQLDELKKRALSAVAPIARQAQVRVEPKPKKPVVASDPPKPPPSPLSDLEIEDGPAELPPEEPTLEVGEVQDLMAEVGGGTSGDDVERARRQAELDETEQLQLAKDAYQTAARTSEGGPWPFWEQLGEFEHAGWRYFVMNGGEPPKLTKEPRKVAHSMGVVP